MKSEKKYEKLPNETFDEYLDRVSAAAKPKPPEWPKALAKQRQRDLMHTGAKGQSTQFGNKR